MTRLRWKIYKALCWIAWRICPDRERVALGYIWDEGMQRFKDAVMADRDEIKNRADKIREEIRDG